MSASAREGRPLPKFGEWDVNDPASADEFTVIFSKARDDKKMGTASSSVRSQQKQNCLDKNDEIQYPTKRKWFCCIHA